MTRRQIRLPQPDHRPRRATPFIYAAAVGAAWVLAACGPAAMTDLDLLAAFPSAPVLMASADGSLPHMVRVADQREQPQRAQYGEIVAIEPIVESPAASGTGAVVGGVLGAVLGNQVGDGSGRAAATVLGGAGGALAGHKIEKSRSEKVAAYRVHVRMDNGGNRSFERDNLNGLDVGERVRVDGGRLRPA